MDEMEEILQDLMKDETEGYLPKNNKLNSFDENVDLYYEDEYEWDEE